MNDGQLLAFFLGGATMLIACGAAVLIVFGWMTGAWPKRGTGVGPGEEHDFFYDQTNTSASSGA